MQHQLSLHLRRLIRHAILSELWGFNWAVTESTCWVLILYHQTGATIVTDSPSNILVEVQGHKRANITIASRRATKVAKRIGRLFVWRLLLRFKAIICSSPQIQPRRPAATICSEHVVLPLELCSPFVRGNLGATRWTKMIELISYP